MADPFGLVGVISLTVQITQIAIRFGQDYKDGPEEARSFISELGALKTVLSETNTNILLNPDFADAFQGRKSVLLSQLQVQPGVMVKTDTQAMLATCKRELVNLLSDLKNSTKGHQFGWDRFKAALRASKTRTAVGTLHRQCETLNRMMSVDALVLGATTLKEVKEARAEQQHHHQDQLKSTTTVKDGVETLQKAQAVHNSNTKYSLDELRKGNQTHATAISTVGGGVDQLQHHHKESERREQHRAILDWLKPRDYASQQTDIFKRRQKGTGEWLLRSKEFVHWRDHSKETLFCPGIPGAGKTVMTSIVIDHLHSEFEDDSSVGIAYIYCNFNQNDDQTPRNLLLSLLWQLLQHKPSALDMKDYARYKNNRIWPPTNEISRALCSVVANYAKTCIVIDALDECQISEGEREVFLSKIFDLQKETKVNIFATSRFNPDIEKHFKKCVSVQISAQEEDVQHYLRGHMSQLPSFVFTKIDLQEEVEAAIVDAVKGMFLLAELHLASLAGKRSPKALRSALQKLPTGSDAYDNAYKEAMERISSQNRGSKELALQTLSWITCAKRQLTVSELQHALAVETGTSELDEDNITDIEQVASVCAGLVTVDNESRIVRLAHYTTQEYFERAWQSHFPNAQVEIAEACLTYISFDTFEAGPCVSSKALRMRLQSHPLYSYSAQNWGHHVRSMNTNISVDHVLYEFLLNESKVYASAQVIPDYGKAWSLFEYDRSPSEGDIEDRRQVTALHLVAIFGISSAVRHLLNSGSPRDSKDCHLRSPLSWAAEKGHKDMVKLLLEDGRVRVDSRDKNDRTPLHYACRWGSRESVEILTGFGADPGTADNRDRRTPLELAVKHGHEPVVEYLLDLCKVQVNSRNSSGETLLTIAARRGHAQIIKLLLRYGSADLCDRFDWTAIIYAAVYGLIRVVDILLGGQAYKDVFGVHVACGWDHTPLSNATIGGHYSAGERLLVYARVNPDATDFSNRTPLSHAAGGGHHMIVESLLRFTDVDPNARDWTGWTPLMWSAKHGHAAVTALLLSDDRTDPNVRNIENQTPLSVASQWGHISVMELLLKNNAVEVDNKDNSGRTPLQQASEQGEFFVVDLLLRSGARPNHQDKHGATCLSLAAQHGHQFVVQQLLNTEQVNPDFQDKDGRTPLSWAAEGGHKSVVQQLLDTKQVNPDSRDKDGGNPLLWAVENRRQSVVAPLTIAGADTRVPLVKAAGNGCQSTVAAFIEAGADLNIIDDQCKSPLQAAINNGYYDMVRMLVKAGANVEYGTFSSFERKVIGGMRKRHRTA